MEVYEVIVEEHHNNETSLGLIIYGVRHLARLENR